MEFKSLLIHSTTEYKQKMFQQNKQCMFYVLISILYLNVQSRVNKNVSTYSRYLCGLPVGKTPAPQKTHLSNLVTVYNRIS